MESSTKKLINDIMAMDSEMSSLMKICDSTVKQVRNIKNLSKNVEDPEFEQEVKKFEKFVEEVPLERSSS
jgi:hypothetical protein